MAVDQRNLRRLSTLADYRVLTIGQLAEIEGRLPKTVHASLRRLARDRLIVESSRSRPSGPGRREKLVSLTPSGFDALHEAKLLPSNTQEQDVTLAGLPHIEHQLLLNWVRIRWTCLDRICQALRTRFVPHSSPTAPYGQADSVVEEEPVPTVIRLDRRHVFTPDAVATISDVERNRTVLFFVEIDMGTEPIEVHGTPRPTIARKIANYQRCMQSGHYRVYETAWKCELRGFRLLFVTNTQARRELLCHLLDNLCPREFIWITDQNLLMNQGVGAHIWARGGHWDHPAASILGSRIQGGSSTTSPAPLPFA